METDLMERMALVTGSSRGLGKEIAKALASNKVSVIINGRKKRDVERVRSKIESEYKIPALTCVVDATNSKQIKKYFDATFGSTRRLDILVNNVGNIETFGKFEELTEKDWQRSFDLSFMSAVRFITASLPYLKRSNQARIINISSLSGHQPSFNGINPHYAFAKAGIINLTKSLANDFGQYGITVNTICPSTLEGGGWDQNIKEEAEKLRMPKETVAALRREKEKGKSPLSKIGQLKDVADLVVFLSSSKANFLTGHCFNVDGGITRSIL